MIASARLSALAAQGSSLLASFTSETSTGTSIYRNESLNILKALQTLYIPSTGLWNTTGWWNSANCLTVLADFCTLDIADCNSEQIPGVMNTTFTNAQGKGAAIRKMIVQNGTMPYVTIHNELKATARDFGLQERGYAGFINDYYDDEGWWCLAWIRSYDVTGHQPFLDMAQSIFDDMTGGGDSTCGGGIWWSKERKYKNAIANELYLDAAASLANRVPAKQAYYTTISMTQWSWFKSSGMINSNNLVNDGLTIDANGTCTNNGQNTWTYNQGVILGGLVELSKATNDPSLLTTAISIATSAITTLQRNGILYEGCEPNCGADGEQFKGVFMRNLQKLQLVAPQDAFKKFIMANADSIYAKDRDRSNLLGVDWGGSSSLVNNPPTAGSTSSGMDAIVAAMAVS